MTGCFPNFILHFLERWDIFTSKPSSEQSGRGSRWRAGNPRMESRGCSSAQLPMGQAAKRSSVDQLGSTWHFSSGPWLITTPPFGGFTCKDHASFLIDEKKHVLIWSTQLLSWVWPFYGRSTEVIYVIFVKFYRTKEFSWWQPFWRVATCFFPNIDYRHGISTYNSNYSACKANWTAGSTAALHAKSTPFLSAASNGG